MAVRAYLGEEDALMGTLNSPPHTLPGGCAHPAGRGGCPASGHGSAAAPADEGDTEEVLMKSGGEKGVSAGFADVLLRKERQGSRQSWPSLRSITGKTSARDHLIGAKII